MPAPKGIGAVAFTISSEEAVHVYGDAGRIWLQLRRNVLTKDDIETPSFKVVVTLTQKQAIAIAGELLTAATCHHPAATPVARSTEPPAATVPPEQANKGKLWTAEEERKLLDAFDSGMSVARIAKAHSRGTGGICSRLIRLGRITRDQYASYVLTGERPTKMAGGGLADEPATGT